MTERYSDYDEFALCYDRHWCEEVPPQIFTVIERLLLPHIPSDSHILDLCCGTGYTVARLEQLGYRVTGVDGSSEMLGFARRRAKRSRFKLADARSFRFKHSFDAIISTFDSLNHVMTLAALEAVLRNVHDALAPSAPFLFDMNMESGFISHWAEHFSIVTEDNACVLRGHYDRREKVGRYDITVFRRSGRVWQRSDTVIKERCYSMKEIRGALQRAGFSKVLSYDAERDLGLEDHTGRRFFLARKDA